MDKVFFCKPFGADDYEVSINNLDKGKIIDRVELQNILGTEPNANKADISNAIRTFQTFMFRKGQVIELELDIEAYEKKIAKEFNPLLGVDKNKKKDKVSFLKRAKLFSDKFYNSKGD